jgi:short-subunit dehydrogenase
VRGGDAVVGNGAHLHRIVRRMGIALVTGGTSGIGAEFARQLATRGDDLVLVARDRKRLDDMAAELGALGRSVEVIVADLSREKDRAKVAARLADTARPVDVLVNNAGFGYFRPFSAADWQRDAELLQLNIGSLVELARRFVDDRRAEAGRAYLVNVASIGAYQAVPNMAVYASSKAFVRNFTEALHDELRGSPISATCICPGGTETGFHAAAGAGNYGWLANRSMMSAAAVARITVAAMRAGKRNVVTGLHNKIATWSVRLVPRRIASWLSSRVLGKPKAAALPARSAA